MFGHKWFLKIGELTDASVIGLKRSANELVHCSVSFYQGIDYKGQVQTAVRAGDIVLTYDGLPSKEVIEWAMTSTKLYSGVLVLCDSDEMPIDKIFFEDAACINMSVNYINEGKSSIITQLRLQARKLISGHETLVQPWTNIPTSQGPVGTKSSSVVTQVFKLYQPIGKTTLKLSMEGRNYEIERFKINFSQGIDLKGQPQEETNGGIVEFSITNLPDELFNKWMIRETDVKDGIFVFEQGDQNSPLKISFSEAYCINMAIRTSLGRGLYTDYIISANEIDLNGKWLYKNFKL